MSAGAVASSAALSTCGLVKKCDDGSILFIYDVRGSVIDASLSIIKERETLGDDQVHQEDFDHGTVCVCTQEFKRKNRQFGIGPWRPGCERTKHILSFPGSQC